MKDDMTLKTLSFLTQKLDEIVGKSDLINEILEETTDKRMIRLLQRKLVDLEKELAYITEKVNLEKKMLKKV